MKDKKGRHKRRKECRERDRCCAVCGSESILQVHHLKPVSKGGSWDLDNLILLCSDCHRVADVISFRINWKKEAR